MAADLTRFLNDYAGDGYVSGIPVLSRDQADQHRRALERAEAEFGPLHYRTKIHTILTSPYDIATHPDVLDIVENIIGPDILLYNVTYIIKEPKTASHVSWHQDLTYWGLSHDDQVTMWLALSPATGESGCMRMIPGSHRTGSRRHHPTDDDTNVLLQGQTVPDIAEDRAVLCPLDPGEASFHHGWTLHASLPNRSTERRIGVNVQYFAAHVRQTKYETDSALLVRGEDRFCHFEPDIPATCDLAPDGIARQAVLEQRYLKIAGAENQNSTR